MKLFRGWCLPENKDKPAFFLRGSLNDKMYVNIYRTKGYKADYHPDNWPPVRVKVTIEVED